MNFTNSPYERMMQEIPRKCPPKRTGPPLGSPCHGCAYFREPACVGVCYRKLILSQKGVSVTSGQSGPKLPGRP